MADHDPRAREVIGNMMTPRDAGLDWADRCLAHLHRAGLRVVGASPSEADVERSARAMCEDVWGNTFDLMGEEERAEACEEARAAIAAYLAQGGGDG